MCIYTLKKQKLKKKFLMGGGGGVRDSTERPKIRRLWRKGYRKNYIKDLGMLTLSYIQVEYSVFSAGSSLFTM